MLQNPSSRLLFPFVFEIDVTWRWRT